MRSEALRRPGGEPVRGGRDGPVLDGEPPALDCAVVEGEGPLGRLARHIRLLDAGHEVLEVELAVRASHDAHGRPDEAEVAHADVAPHQPPQGQARLQAIELDERLPPIALRQPQLLDGHVTGEEIEIDVFDADLAPDGLGHLPHHDLAHDLGKRGKEARDEDDGNHHEDDAELAETGEPAARPVHALARRARCPRRV